MITVMTYMGDNCWRKTKWTSDNGDVLSHRPVSICKKAQIFRITLRGIYTSVSSHAILVIRTVGILPNIDISGS